MAGSQHNREGLARGARMLRTALGTDSLRSSFQAGNRAVSGDAAPDGDGPAPAAPAAGGQPAWAKRMKRSQQLTHGVQAAAHAVRSGDAHGGGSSISLDQGDRA